MTERALQVAAVRQWLRERRAGVDVETELARIFPDREAELLALFRWGQHETRAA